MNNRESFTDITVAVTYPIRGLLLFVTNPGFWSILWKHVQLSSLFSAGIYEFVYLCIFTPQYELFCKYHGQGALISATALALSESLVIFQALYGGYFLDEALVDAFDATFIKYSLEHLIAPCRELNLTANNAAARLGKPTRSINGQPWDLLQIAHLITLLNEEGRYSDFLGMQLFIYLPLHFIPYLGTPAFFIIAGHRYAQFLQKRLCQILELSQDEAQERAQKMWWEYAAFGSVALIFQLIPFLSFGAFFTNSIGSALWAIRVHKKTLTEQ